MRISATEIYFHHDRIYPCHIEGCQRNYCSEHRLLFRDCDTAIKTYDGAGQTLYDLNDCPECVNSERMKRWQMGARLEH